MSRTEISVSELKQVLSTGTANAVIIDVRSPGEYRAGRIKGARNIPIEKLEEQIEGLRKFGQVFVHCNSGNQSSEACQKLRELGLKGHVNVLGGIFAWEEAGFEVVRDKRTMPIFRQVMTAAGALVTTGMILAWRVSPWFLVIPAFVGCGMMVSGLTGFCLMARILGKMPWNARGGAIDLSMGANTTASASASGCGPKPSCGATPNATTAPASLKSPSRSFLAQQFIDKDLAHFSYAIVSGGVIAVIDPMRKVTAYTDFASANNAKIVAIIETHPHADFVSGHRELSEQTGATVYVHSLVQAEYPHQAFDHGATISLGRVTLRSLHTPGHSPDSVTVLLEDENGATQAAFTGDTLFVGDVGRPDLREKAGAVTSERRELAGAMYHSTRDTLMKVLPSALVYPAHGAGTLCGKNLRSDTFSTVGQEIESNPALQPMNESEFVNFLTADQPYIPKYFGNSVALNKKGAPPYEESVRKAYNPVSAQDINPSLLVVDTRAKDVFHNSRLPNSVNINDKVSFATWLGSIVAPDEDYYLLADSESTARHYVDRAAAIGYEARIRGVIIVAQLPSADGSLTQLSPEQVSSEPGRYTILDVRSPHEAQKKIFPTSVNIPLNELRERLQELPQDKPIVVHCGGGYRSTIATSILLNRRTDVIDLGNSIAAYTPTAPISTPR